MLRRVQGRLTYANVVATIALFGVLAGGVAVAAGLKKNSVGKKQLKTGAVITKKLADGSVNEPKLADGAVTTGKLGDNVVTGAKVDESTLGTVPSALQATDAENAQTAVAAGLAANAQALAGNPLGGVRSRAAGTSSTTNALVGSGPLLEQTIAVPQGGGTVTGVASLSLFNAVAATATTVECSLESGRDGTFTAMGPSSILDIGTSATLTTDVHVSVAGIAEAVPAGTQTVRVVCTQTADLAFFNQGSLVVEVQPTG